MGMTEVGGKVKAYHVPSRETHIILNKITDHVDPGAFIMTDEAKVYKKLDRIGYFNHGSVKHGKKHWSYKGVNTNSIESFWALFKRNYHGTYHSMSKKHLQRYINEIAFRFNNRGNDMATKFDLVTNTMAKRGRMPYKALTA
jgi:hypothetical protein